MEALPIFTALFLRFVSMHCRFDSAVSWSGTHNLVDPTGLDVALTRCLEGYCDQIPATEIEVVLLQLTVCTTSVVSNAPQIYIVTEED